jgi:eukaryotic-like serine/threonine-protein kinase
VTRSMGTSVGGKWSLVRMIGAGGTANVYEVRGPTVPRAAAKLLNSGTASNPSWQRRFAREARLLQAIVHPGLPVVFDFGTDGDSQFLVMELLSGASLDAWAQRDGARLSPAQVIALGLEALDVLAAVHAEGVIHRDIKPSNLFLTEQGRLKMLDFGIASGPVEVSEADSQTRGLLGTPAYMAPEQARGRWDLVDRRSDLWSMAAVLFTLLTGEHVHPADTANEQLGLAMTLSARSIALLLPELDSGIAAAIDKALDYDRARRFQSAAQFRHALAFPVAPKRRASRAAKVDETLRTGPQLRPVALGATWRKHQLVAPLLLSVGFALSSDRFHSNMAPPLVSRTLAGASHSAAPAEVTAVDDTAAPRAGELRLALADALPQARSSSPLARVVKERVSNRALLLSAKATPPPAEPEATSAVDLQPASLPTFDSIDPLDIRR